jgi:hypothetical protein
MLNKLMNTVKLNIVNYDEIKGRVRRIDFITGAGNRVRLFEDDLRLLEEPIVLLSKVNEKGEDLNLAAFCSVQFDTLVSVVKGLSEVV